MASEEVCQQRQALKRLWEPSQWASLLPACVSRCKPLTVCHHAFPCPSWTLSPWNSKLPCKSANLGFSSARMTRAYHHPLLWWDVFWILSWSPRTCKTHAFPTEPSPQPKTLVALIKYLSGIRSQCSLANNSESSFKVDLFYLSFKWHLIVSRL